MRRLRCLLPLLFALMLLPAGAQAACLYKPFVFFPKKNDGVLVTSLVDAGSRCVHQFGEGPGYKFTGITFEAPEHGKITEVGPTFIYVPDAGFKGVDEYTFKICATKGALKGCSAVAFVATVK